MCSRAFTLIELLVVVAILTLLIAIFVPSASLARQSASSAKCAANLHNVGQFIHVYANAHGDLVAPAVRERDFRWDDREARGWDIETGKNAGEAGGRGSIWRCQENDAPYLGNARALGLDTSIANPGGPVYRIGSKWWHEPSKLALAYDIQVNLFDPPFPFAHTRDASVGDVSDEVVRGWDRESDAPTMALSLDQYGPHREAFGVLFADGHAAVRIYRDASDGLLWSGRRWWP